MKTFRNLLSFEEVAKELGCDSSDIRGLVVEEKRLPAVMVTLVGHKEPYDFQLLNVGDNGMAFDLVRGFDGSVHTGYLRVERAALDQFSIEVGVSSTAAPPVQPMPAAAAKKLTSKEESTYLNTIAVLLELIQSTNPDRCSAAAVIKEMVENYSDKYGISKSQLEKTFAAANRNLRAN